MEKGNRPVRGQGFIRAVGGRRPTVHSTAWVAHGASVTGSVLLAASSSVWYGASVRGDLETIEIGRGSNVQDCSALHADPDFPLRLGESVSVGHAAVLHGCTIGDRVLVGMSATVLNGVVVGHDCVIGAGTLLTQGMVVPPGSLVLGSPGKVARSLTDAERQSIVDNAAAYLRLVEHHDRAEPVP